MADNAYTPIEAIDKSTSDELTSRAMRRDNELAALNKERPEFFDAMGMGFSQFSLFADVYNVVNNMGRDAMFGEQSGPLDREKFILEAIELGVTPKVASDIADDSDSEFEAGRRLKTHLDSTEAMGAIMSTAGGKVGAGIGFTLDLVTGASAIDAIKAGSTAMKLNGVTRAINSAAGRGIIGATEGMGYTALANEASQNEGGYLLGATLGGTLGALTSFGQRGHQVDSPRGSTIVTDNAQSVSSSRVGEMRNSVRNADGEIVIDAPDTSTRTTTATKTRQDMEADMNVANDYGKISQSELSVSDYRQSLNDELDRLLEEDITLTSRQTELENIRVNTLDDIEANRLDLDSLNDAAFLKAEDIKDARRQLQDEFQSQADSVTQAMNRKTELEDLFTFRKGGDEASNLRKLKGTDYEAQIKESHKGIRTDAEIARINKSLEQLQEGLSKSKKTPEDFVSSRVDEGIETFKKARKARGASKRLQEVDDEMKQLNESLSNNKKLRENIDSELNATSAMNQDELVDLADVRYQSMKGRLGISGSRHADEQISQVMSEDTQRSILVASENDPVRLTDMAQRARAEGNDELADLIETTNLKDPITEEVKQVKQFTAEELEQMGKDRQRSYTADSKAYLIDTVSDNLRNSESLVTREVGARLMGVKGLEDVNVVNTTAGSDFKESMINAAKDEYLRINQRGFEAYYKEVTGRKANMWTRAYAQFTDHYKDYVRKVSQHNLMSQSNPNADELFEASVVSTSKDIGKLIGKYNKRARDAGWTEGDDIFITPAGSATGFVSRVLDTERVKQIPVLFDKMNRERFNLATEGAIIMGNPKWALTDAKIRNPENARLLSLIDDVEAAGWKLDHQMTTRILNTLEQEGLTRQTKIVAKTYMQNAIRRSQMPGYSPMNSKVASVDEVLKELNENKELLKDLTGSERNLIEQVITTQLARQGADAGKPNQFKRRIKMDPSYTIKGNDKTGADVDISYLSMLSNDLDSIVGNQMVNLSSGFGLAKVGIKDFDSLDSVIANAIEDASTQLNRRQVKRDVAALEQTRKYYRGEKNFDNTTLGWRLNTAVRKANMLKLGKLFVNIIPESANVNRITGTNTFGLAPLKVLAGTYGNVLFAARRDERLRDVLDAAGAISTQSVRRVYADIDNTVQIAGTRNASWGNDTRDLATKSVEALNTGGDFISAMMLKTYAAFERSQRMEMGKFAMQGLHNVFIDGGLGSLSKKQAQRAKQDGISDAFFDMYTEASNKGMFTVEGNKIKDVDVDRLQKEMPEFWDEYSAILNREVSYNVLNDTADKMPVFTNGQLFAVFGQFRSFQLLSLNHVLRYDMKMKDAAAVSAMVWGSILGGLTHSINEIMSGRGDELEPLDILTGGLRRHGSLQLFTAIADTMLDITGNDPVFAKGATAIGNSVLDPNSSTLISTANSLYNIAKDTVSIPFGDDSEESAVKAAKGIVNTFVPNLPMVRETLREGLEEL